MLLALRRFFVLAGIINETMDGFVASSSAKAGEAGSISETAPPFTSGLTASEGALGVGSPTIGAMVSTGTGLIGEAGAEIESFQPFVSTATGIHGLAGVADTILGDVIISASASHGEFGGADLQLGAMVFDLTAIEGALGIGAPTIDPFTSSIGLVTSSYTMLQRLLGSLHRVFERGPDQVLAFRVQSGSGCTWTVAGDTLTVLRPGMAATVLPLQGTTIGGVCTALTAAGFMLPYTADADTLARSAMTLLEGSGDQYASNGDHLLSYTSLLWSWLDAAGRELADAKQQIVEMLRQMIIRQSDGSWTDLWGSYFGCLRRSGESDAMLADRIVYELRRARSNAYGIAANVEHFTGAKVTVREPWREMCVLSGAVPLGAARFPNATEFTYHVAQLQSVDFVDWDAVMLEAAADRPAGTVYLTPITKPLPWLVQVYETAPIVEFTGYSRSIWQVAPIDGEILSVNAGLSSSYRLLNPTIFYKGFLPYPVIGGSYPTTGIYDYIDISVSGGAIVDKMMSFGVTYTQMWDGFWDSRTWSSASPTISGGLIGS